MTRLICADFALGSLTSGGIACRAPCSASASSRAVDLATVGMGSSWGGTMLSQTESVQEAMTMTAWITGRA